MTDDRNERDNHGALTDWALACAALEDNGCDHDCHCAKEYYGFCLACLCGSAMKTERARAEKAEAELERRQAGWHPIPPAPALSGHELCVLTQAGSVREATDAEILAHPVVAALVARKFDRPEG